MKIIIIEATQVVFDVDVGGEHVDSGAIVDVSKEQATKLTQANRALYVNKSDDSFKDGRYTASADMVKAAEALAKSKAKSKKVEPPPVIPPVDENENTGA